VKPSSTLRPAVAEFLGTAFLLAAIVGSGIMGERLAEGNPAIALLANSIATGAMLIVLILTFGDISGAHFNPLVTRAVTPLRTLPYFGAQLLGAVLGVACANLMFGLPVFSLSDHARAGGPQLLSEFIATFGLLLVVLLTATSERLSSALAVAGYIAAAYWFTASTSFANPVVTIARSLSDTFAGIRPADVLPFVIVQVGASLLATRVFRWIAHKERS
jgi:glycerol uptake facilitator-like aquaporin